MMHKAVFFIRLFGVSLVQLCKRKGLLAVLILLCLCLPLCISPAAEHLFQQGVSFSGITLAITAPEGDPVPSLLEEFLPSLSDVSQYCQVVALDYDKAVRQLSRGEVTAVLVLPEDFVQGILNGSNPDVELIVPADRPLEALLTLWVGQSAADMLAAFQGGIYAVLEIYGESPPEGMDFSQVVTQINLRYINWTLNRQDMFRVKEISITDQLPIGLHYGLSLLCFLLLSLAPFFHTLYTPDWIASQRRLLAVSRRPISCFIASFFACWAIIFCIMAITLLLIVKGSVLLCLSVCLLCSLFCAAFLSLCSLIAGNAGTCGVFSSLSALLFLTLSGGILPAVLLPQTLRSLIPASPITWMRNLLALPSGQIKVQVISIAGLATGALLMLGCSMLLYRRRFAQEVDRR